MTMRFQLLSLVVIVSLAARGNCIRCYSCGSLEKGCDDPFDSSVVGSVECTTYNTSSYYGTEYEACYKAKLTIAGITSVIRGCGDVDVGNQCETYSGVEYCYYTCRTDECNGATFITSSVVLLMTSALTYLIIR
ncbi:uncharacterized protein [Antedon mediterranea]|uniref:uncharacterized protein n=1 Tax=Antedon mediterranea TaxID=105859 RepID=UPI003AF9C22C